MNGAGEDLHPLACSATAARFAINRFKVIATVFAAQNASNRNRFCWAIHWLIKRATRFTTLAWLALLIDDESRIRSAKDEALLSRV